MTGANISHSSYSCCLGHKDPDSNNFSIISTITNPNLRGERERKKTRC